MRVETTWSRLWHARLVQYSTTARRSRECWMSGDWRAKVPGARTTASRTDMAGLIEEMVAPYCSLRAYADGS